MWAYKCKCSKAFTKMPNTSFGSILMHTQVELTEIANSPSIPYVRSMLIYKLY